MLPANIRATTATSSSIKLKNFFESNAPPTVKVPVDLLTTGEPALVSYELPEMQAAKRANEIGWGATPIFVRGGGSIPIVSTSR